MKTNVLRSGATIFARDIPFGGNNYTQAIAQRLNISFEQAEAAKLGKDVGVKWETLVPPLEAVSRDLSLEVQRTFDYFASTAESERIGKIVLAGGCAQLPGLNEYLSSNWGIPVELARPFERIEVASGLRGRRQRAGARAGRRRRTGAAAARRQGTAQMIRINLAPPEARRRRPVLQPAGCRRSISGSCSASVYLLRRRSVSAIYWWGLHVRRDAAHRRGRSPQPRAAARSRRTLGQERRGQGPAGRGQAPGRRPRGRSPRARASRSSCSTRSSTPSRAISGSPASSRRTPS